MKDREIKFRLRSLKTKKVIGYECIWDNEWAESGNGVDWQPLKRTIAALREQYTGLKDKNGVEIYEGDLVIYLDQKWEVVWISGEGNIGNHNDQWGMSPGFSLCLTKPNPDYDEYCELSSDSIFEVIGNIYYN